MKILYAVQATGNGHISRALQLYPYLQEHGTVDFFLSGSNAQLNTPLPIKFKSKGVSLFYKKSGGLDYTKILNSLTLGLYNDAKSLPVQNYDVVINDFEFVTSLACSLKKVPSVHFGHQASFQSKKTPRAKSYNPLGNLILEKFVKSDRHIGLHFDNYDEHVYNPIIKEEVIEATPINDGHISVYLPQYSIAFLEPYLLAESAVHFEVFTKEVTQITCKKNICYFPISNTAFTNSMIRSMGIITAGGFETPAEAMYMNKKLLCIPIIGHFEQECNAEALSRMGIMTLKKIDKNFAMHFAKWMKESNVVQLHLTHSTKQIVSQVLQKAQK
jgi:uncharacterized protein (TIGR00661 family)